MPTKIRLRIKGGRAKGIYSDAFVPYLEKLQGHVVERASHVEPDNAHTHGGNWVVDLSPVQGGVHYKDEKGRPFLTRQEALEFEVRQLNHIFKLGGTQDVGANQTSKRGDRIPATRDQGQTREDDGR